MNVTNSKIKSKLSSKRWPTLNRNSNEALNARADSKSKTKTCAPNSSNSTLHTRNYFAKRTKSNATTRAWRQNTTSSTPNTRNSKSLIKKPKNSYWTPTTPSPHWRVNSRKCCMRTKNWKTNWTTYKTFTTNWENSTHTRNKSCLTINTSMKTPWKPSLKRTTPSKIYRLR